MHDRAGGPPPEPATERRRGLDGHPEHLAAVLTQRGHERRLTLQGHGVGDETATGRKGRQAALQQVRGEPATEEHRIRSGQRRHRGIDVAAPDLDLGADPQPRGVPAGAVGANRVLLDTDRLGGRLEPTGPRPFDGDRPGSTPQVPQPGAGSGTQVSEGEGSQGPLCQQPVVLEGLVGQPRSGPESGEVTVGQHPGSVTAPARRPGRRRRRALLVVHTGDGKGKTTAAMGLAMRGWAQGWSIGIVQFVKSGRWRTGEQAALEALGRMHAETGAGGPVHWYQAGTGGSWSRAGTGDRALAAARRGWETTAGLLAREAHDLYVLDELTYPLQRAWLDAVEVTAALRDRPGHQHVVVTGRRCPAALLDAADLVTEMVNRRHPLADGISGQAGIEW